MQKSNLREGVTEFRRSSLKLILKQEIFYSVPTNRTEMYLKKYANKGLNLSDDVVF